LESVILAKLLPEMLLHTISYTLFLTQMSAGKIVD